MKSSLSSLLIQSGALSASAFALVIGPSLHAQDALIEWIKDGKANLTLNARYEYGAIDGTDEADAATLKTLLGYTTGNLNGFSAKVEFTDTSALDDESYNAAGLNGQPGKTVIADPETTELNQFFLKYGQEFGSVTVGRQRYILDNARFVGNVGWRQNEQTFDAVSVELSPFEGFTLKAAYLDKINRIFADARDWECESVLINGTYKLTPELSVTGYYYYLDFKGATPTTGTLGGYVSGKLEDLGLTYRAEVAYQEYTESDISTLYTHLVVGYQLGSVNLQAGYEVLGSDDGMGVFLTPLATAHAYNGFADTYLNNGGAGGLQDIYFSAGTKFGKLALTGFYHLFDSDEGSAAEGSEFDAVAAYPLADGLKVLAKLALYEGENLADRERFILQLTATY